MAKFEAQLPDLQLELTMLNGDSVTINPRDEMNTSNVKKILSEWEKLEEKNKDEKDETTPFDLIALELASVYEKESSWWQDNFDFRTLADIIAYVGETLGGLKKKRSTSKR